MDKRITQAIRTLRAIRQRYETESDAYSGRRRSYSVQVALGYADMLWIAAAVEALEKMSVSSSALPAANEAWAEGLLLNDTANPWQHGDG